MYASFSLNLLSNFHGICLHKPLLLQSCKELLSINELSEIFMLRYFFTIRLYLKYKTLLMVFNTVYTFCFFIFFSF